MVGSSEVITSNLGENVVKSVEHNVTSPESSLAVTESAWLDSGFTTQVPSWRRL